MALFVKIDQGLVVSNLMIEENIKALFPEKFTDTHAITSEDLLDIGYAIYVRTEPPAVIFPNKVIEDGIRLGEDNIAYQNWIVVEMQEEEKNAHLKQKRIECENERLKCDQCAV